jgi:ribonuclease HI
VYTDGSKTGDTGVAGIIFVNGKLVHQLKFKLHGHCSNNQAEQIAILKVLELEKLQDGQDNDKRIAIYTDSKVTLDLLQNKFKQNRVIEFIRNKINALVHLKWTMHFSWVKGHVGIEGNELVTRLAQEAAVEDGPIVYKMTRKVIILREKENGLHMWQWQRTNTGKGAVTKAFFL